MKAYRFFKNKFAVLLAFISLVVVYIKHAPITVQTGDSGELSAAAFALLVPHPPGYPLWVWLNHLWLSFVNLGTTYFSLSVLNIIISLSALKVLTSFIKSSALQFFIILTVGLSGIYWKFSLLPEVFYLNLLLALALVYFGTTDKKIPNTEISIAAVMMPLIYSLSVANHHTTLFMMPFVIWCCWKHRKSKWLYISIASGIAICAILYLSMMTMHPDHIYSWGKIDSAADVLHHFLRKDYGTFDLARNKNEGVLWHLFDYFNYHFIRVTGPLILLALIAAHNQVKKKSRLIWRPYQSAVASCVVIYIFVFLPLMKMAPVNDREEVVERFFLLPITLTVLLLATFIDSNFDFKSRFKSTLLYTCALVISVTSLIFHSRVNDYSDNMIVSDYARNILNVASEFKNPLLLIGQDTQVFGVRYEQVVENNHPEILVMPRTFFTSDPFVEKIRKAMPQLVYRYEELKKTKYTIATRDLIEPNEGNVTFISDEDEFPYEIVKLTYLPLGVMVSKGAGVTFHKTKYVPQFRSDSSIIATAPDKFDLFRNILSKYTYYFVAQAYVETKAGNISKAIDSYERALGIFPFNVTALRNLCDLKSKNKISDEKCDHINDTNDYFDYYKYSRAR